MSGRGDRASGRGDRVSGEVKQGTQVCQSAKMWEALWSIRSSNRGKQPMHAIIVGTKWRKYMKTCMFSCIFSI